VKTVRGFDSLHLMLVALRGSMEVLLWSVVLLVVVQMVLALLVQRILHDMYFLDERFTLEERQAVYEYFGTFSRAMLTMFEMTLANWPPVCRLMTEFITEWWILFALAHKLTIGFAVVGVINGVFMQETVKAASSDNNIMLRQKMRDMQKHERKMMQLFEEADKSGDGFLDLEEFRAIVSHEQVRVWLSSMELDTSDVDNLYHLLKDGNDDISRERLVAGVAKLKGSARSIDLAMLKQDMKAFQEDVAQSLYAMKSVATHVHVCLQRLSDNASDQFMFV